MATRLSTNNFTLALSSGFFGFYAHVGFLKALDELNLRPSSYTGTSAGAIVAAAAARGFSVNEIEKLVCRISRKEFWDPCLGFGFLRGRKMQDLLAREIGTDFNELKSPLRIPVYDVLSRSTHVFTSGNLSRIVRASCSVPLMFHPVKIDRRHYLDGGIQDKMGIYGLDHNEKILSHYLESSSRDPHAIYELKRDAQMIKARGSNLVKIQLKGLPQSHPFAMDRGPEIIRIAHEKALRELKPLAHKGVWTF